MNLHFRIISVGVIAALITYVIVSILLGLATQSAPRGYDRTVEKPVPLERNK